MNPFLNPLISIPFLKNYIQDTHRLQRLNSQELKKYRNKAFRHIIHYAYNTPLYHNKYKKAGIHPKDIKGLTDITKLPFITKKDIINNFPDNIIPPNYPKTQGYIVSTGGTTGKPVSLYTDFPTILRSIGTMQAQLHYFNLNIRKIRIAHLGNFSRYRIDKVIEDNFLPKLRYVYSQKNTLNIDVGNPIKEIMKKLDEFQPDLIISYPAIFQHLAYLKKNGYGQNVQPKLLQVGGAILDEYTRDFVEAAFHCKLLNIYLSVEAQTNIAFECRKHHWHIHSDFFHLEAIDDQTTPVPPGKRGHIVLTRLFGKGTPIIRYTGMDDWVTLTDDEYPECEFHSPIFAQPIEGRMRANIILPNGKIFPPGAFCFISPVLHDLHTHKITQFQIIQHKIDQIEIRLVQDPKLTDTKPTFKEIANKIIAAYQQKVGPDVTISVNEVAEIKSDSRTGKPAPIVVSYVNPKQGEKLLESN